MAGDAKANKVDVFVSFANGDKKSIRHRDVWNQFANCLEALRVEGVIREWRSHAIDAENQDPSAFEVLKRADIVIFALGQNYLDHPERHRQVLKNLPESGRYLVFSLLLYQALWRNTQFDKFNLLPANKRPVIDWKDPEDAFMEIKDAIRQARQAIYPGQKKPALLKKDAPDPSPSPDPGTPATPSESPRPQSSSDPTEDFDIHENSTIS